MQMATDISCPIDTTTSLGTTPSSTVTTPTTVTTESTTTMPSTTTSAALLPYNFELIRIEFKSTSIGRSIDCQNVTKILVS